jgi:hypothetical protein
MSMHFEWEPLLNLFNPCNKVGIWINIRSLSGVSLGWAKWEKWGQMWEVNKNLSIANLYTKNCLSWMVLSQFGICHSYFGLDMEIKMFLRLRFIR